MLEGIKAFNHLLIAISEVKVIVESNCLEVVNIVNGTSSRISQKFTLLPKISEGRLFSFPLRVSVMLLEVQML